MTEVSSSIHDDHVDFSDSLSAAPILDVGLFFSSSILHFPSQLGTHRSLFYPLPLSHVAQS